MTRIENTTNDVDVDLGRLFASLAREWHRILIVALVITGIAFVLAWLAKPLYRAETRILIETGESIFTRPQDTNNESNSPSLDAEGVASQVEVILSTNVLKQVAQQLNLAGRDEFDDIANPSLLDWVMVVAGLKADPSEIPADERVLKKFREKLNVYRVENSRVIVIEFSSRDPKLAAEVPNAIAKVYLQAQSGVITDAIAEVVQLCAANIAALYALVKQDEP